MTTALMTFYSNPHPPERPRPGQAALLESAAGPSAVEPLPHASSLGGQAAPSQLSRALEHLLPQQLLPVLRLFGEARRRSVWAAAINHTSVSASDPSSLLLECLASV